MFITCMLDSFDEHMFISYKPVALEFPYVKSFFLENI